MRPNTLKEAIERIRDEDGGQFAIREFVDEFLGADAAGRRAKLAEEPPRVDPETDALAGALAEYLAKRHAIGGVPDWAAGDDRTLPEPIFYGPSDAPAMRGYLAVSSPPEFMRHNIFTGPRPFRRARGG